MGNEGPQKPAPGTVMKVTPDITIAELAELMSETPATLIKKLFMMNIVRSANQALSTDVAGQLLAQFGYGMAVETSRQERSIEAELEGADMVPVPPVVTVMGHVDHGKTSLLDTIRSANVQTGEAGGITQRIGAYETEHNGHRIVFLDTPGHEAFTRMRARGAHVTDIAILVVAADDGVMPQTREAMDHAKAARVPIIIAMNKMDKPDADPNHVKAQLAENGLIPEDYGGDTVVMPVSAKTGMGVQELLDMVLLIAEMQELKAVVEGFAEGTIIEARQDPQRGPVATVLLHKGTLKIGDHVVVGDVYGRVRAMHDYKGDLLESAGPKTPVSLLGLSAVPHASDTLRSVANAREAREQALLFGEDSKTARQIGRSRASLEDFFAQLKKGDVKELNVIVKADGQGSVEALCQSLEKLAHDEVRVKIISRGAGNVNESDVMLAAASEAIIIGFAIGTESAAVSLADREKIEIRTYNVIYDALNDVKDALEGMLKPIYQERETGEAEVRATFKSTKAGVIAGCLVTKGKIHANSIMRVYRKNQKVYEGKIDSLRHVKSDVKEMTAGQECGIASNSWNGFEEGDRVVGVVMDQIKRTIDS
jgi:translation initiation factor IF-2